MHPEQFNEIFEIASEQLLCQAAQTRCEQFIKRQICAQPKMNAKVKLQININMMRVGSCLVFGAKAHRQ